MVLAVLSAALAVFGLLRALKGFIRPGGTGDPLRYLGMLGWAYGSYGMAVGLFGAGSTLLWRSCSGG